ncbi:MAG: HAMP domain-containing protein [Burkholderiales bacterium]|nr:HAMP domain-containing protein [Burkholderiales bacterium]
MTRSARWTWIVALTALTGLVLVLTFVVRMGFDGGSGSAAGERRFVWLFWANVAVAALLTLVIGFAAVRLLLRLRRGKFGSRLLIKLAGIFALVGLLPGLTIYAVSYQFVARSIEAWFDVRLAQALDAGLSLGKGTLDALVADLSGKARLAAERVGEGGGTIAPLGLERLRQQIGVAELALVSGGGQVRMSAGGSTGSGAPERPSATLLRQAREVGVASQIDGLDEEALAAPRGTGARVRALARVPSRTLDIAPEEDRYLLLVQPLARSVAVNALAVQEAYAEYQQRALARDGLRRMYIGTLTLALILAVFGAVLLAILLGTQLARPLLLLADGVRQVAAGDLTAKPVFASGDELGGLTRSFADMTAQLAEAREQVQGGVALLEGARARLQTILDTLSAGVIVLDPEGRIDTVNPSATRILRLPFGAWQGRRLDEVPELEGLAQSIGQRFEMLHTSPEAGERDQWQESWELARGDGAVISLLVRGAQLPGAMRLLVFDDISDVVSAQRSAAWGEVARRLAHEIKNPLTPIQLSAERLQHRLQDKLEGAEKALLLRSVATIVSQVQAMQRLVNEFRDYARLPAAQPRPLDLNLLVQELLALYGQALDAGVLAAQLEPALPLIMGDATQLRQVIHNLLQNALDAVSEQDHGRVLVRTSSARGEHGELHAVRLTVLDNGPGFAEKVLKRAFEPYVTTKAKGTGLGLAVVKKIADEHHAQLRLANLQRDDDPGGEVVGARVSLSFSRFAPAAAATAATQADAGGADTDGGGTLEVQ